jgi:sugar phosphate isomerase/epimerase
MKLGISTLSFRDQPLDKALLQTLQESGIESVELTDYHPGFAFDDVAYFEALGSDLNALDLHLNSLHIHLEQFDTEFNLATLDAGQQKKTLTAYRKAVAAMAALGGGILVTHDIRIPEPAEPQHDAHRKVFLENLGIIASEAESSGVRLVLENTSRGYTRMPERLVGLMEDLGAPNVGVIIDTGHRNLVGDPVEMLRAAGRYLMALHIHDNHGERDEHLLPGRGNIAWQEVMQALRETNYSGVFMYELGRAEDLGEVRANFEALNC